MYLNYFQHKNKIHLKFIDEEGNPKYHIERDYSPPIFVYNSSTNGESAATGKTIFGQGLVRLNNSSQGIWDTKQMVKDYDTSNFPVFGFSKIASSYIYDVFKNQEVDFNKIHTCYIDIETEVESGFPNKENPEEEVNIITMYSTNSKKYHTFYVNDIDMTDEGDIVYTKCTDETQLFMKFVDLWKSDYPDIITGWNIDGFDIVYLYNRMSRVLSEEFANKLSPFGIVNTRTERNDWGDEETRVKIMGVSAVDYLALYKKYARKVRETYRLDFIGKVELKEQKLKHKSGIPGHLLYKEYFKDAIDYNVQDVRLVLNLEKKMKFIYLAQVIAYTTFVNFDEIFSNMRILDNLIYTFLRDRDIYFKWNHNAPPRQSFDGGAVKETMLGKYRWVVSFDVTAEYPSIIRAMNMSPETIQKHVVKGMTVEGILKSAYDLNDMYTHDVAIAANGTTYSKEQDGFMASIVEMLTTERNKYKKLKVDADKAHDKEKSQLYDAYQNARKVMLNSLYGIMGNPYFRFYDIRLAEGITHTGQSLVRWVMNDINKALNKMMNDTKDRCVASDTDSVYFCFDDIVLKKFGPNYNDAEVLNFIREFSDNKVNKLIEKSIANFARYMNCHKPEAFEMKREVISDDCIFIAKKRYIMSVLDKEGAVYERGEEIKITGVEAIKSSTPEVCRDKMEELFKVLLFGKEQEYLDFINDFYKEYKTLSMDDIAENKSVNNINKYLDSQGNMMKGTVINSRAAITYNKLVDTLDIGLEVPKIREKDKIKYIYMTVPNPVKQNVFGWINTLPKQMEYLHEFVNYDLQFEKTFKNAIDPIAKICGIKDQFASESLDDFL